MPFYKIDFGFRIDGVALNRLAIQGLSTFQEPVRVLPSEGYSNKGNTVLVIEAATQAIARAWKIAFINELSSVEVYEPPVVEGQDPPPAALNVWARTGIWSKTVGNATTTISSLPSQPRGVILWGSGISGNVLENPTTTGGSVVFGFSDGTDNRDLAYVAQHNQTTTNANRSIGPKAFHLVDPTGTNTTHILESCTVSMASTSFSLNWDATTLATMGGYFAFGGSDIIECEVKDYEVGTTTSGIVDYTGLGFVPSMSLFLFPFITGGLPWPSSITGTADGLQSISAYTYHNGWTSAIQNQDNVSLTSTHSLQKRSYTMTGMAGNSNTEQQYGRYSTDNAADGFAIEWFNAPAASNTIFTGLFVKGGRWQAGSFIQPTVPGTVRVLTNPEWYARVKGILGVSINAPDITDSNIGVSNAKMSIGAQDSTGSKACLSYASSDMVNPSRESSILTDAKFMRYTSV